MEKKLQVFISSTFTDLIEERQKAVQAVLNSDHIPAGMELFKAGSQDQMTTIKRWIDESDVYMLIVGHRYGSIDPVTQKSYTQLEYEYVIEKNMPHFILFIDEEMSLKKTLSSSNYRKEDIFEQFNTDKFNEFRNSLLSSKLGAFINNLDQIDSNVQKSLKEINRLYSPVGWIRSDQFESVKSEEYELIKKENELLRNQLSTSANLLSASHENSTIGAFTFDEIAKGLRSHKIQIPENIVSLYDLDSVEDALSLFIYFQNQFDSKPKRNTGISPVADFLYQTLIPILKLFNLVEVEMGPYNKRSASITREGNTFLGKMTLLSP